MINTALFKPHNLIMIAGLAIAAHLIVVPLYGKIAGKE